MTLRSKIKKIFENHKINEEETLDFGPLEEPQDLTLTSDVPEMELSRYDRYTDIQDKRKAIIFDIQQNILPENVLEKLPLFIKTLAKFAPPIRKLDDGRFLINMGSDSKTKQYATKLVKFIQTGSGDALSSSSIGEVRDIIKDISFEIERKLPPVQRHSHPTRVLISLLKNGSIDDAIRYYTKLNHYDVFGIDWINSVIRPGVLKQLEDSRKAAADERKMAVNA
jgi:hypothetical protein